MSTRAIQSLAAMGALAAFACGGKADEPNLSDHPTVEAACDTAPAVASTDEDHNVEVVSVTDLDKAGEVTCSSDVASTVGDEGGYVAARVVDAKTGRRALAVRVGPDASEKIWIDSPSVFPVMANGWHSRGSGSSPELFLFGALTSSDPRQVDPVMDGRLLLLDASGAELDKLTIPQDPSSFVHDVCAPVTAGERFHVITSTGSNPLAIPAETMETDADLEAATLLAKGCVAYTYRDGAGWSENTALGNACTCEELPGATCADPCFGSCVFGDNGEKLLSDPVCGPNEECTGAGNVSDPSALASKLGLEPDLALVTANCVPQIEEAPAQCATDSDCFTGSAGLYCQGGRCVDCRSDGDCDSGTQCRDGLCLP